MGHPVEAAKFEILQNWSIVHLGMKLYIFLWIIMRNAYSGNYHADFAKSDAAFEV